MHNIWHEDRLSQLGLNFISFWVFQRNASFSSALVRSHGRAAHKRSTLDILVRARQAAQPTLPVSGVSAQAAAGNVGMSGMQNMGAGMGGGTMIAHPHRFAPSHQTTPTQCDYCEQKLWGPVKVIYMYI